MKSSREASAKNTDSYKACSHAVAHLELAKMNINGLELNDHDLDQRYHNTYIKVHHDATNKDAVVLVAHFYKGGVDLDGDGVLGGGSYATDGIHILQDFPAMGAVNHKGNVHFLSRKPLRQWLRGFHSHLINDFCRNPNVSFEETGINFAIAKSCFNRVWIPLAEGLELLKKDYHSFAINEHYWLSGKKKTYLWRDTTCLGELLGNKLFAFPAVCVMKDEINAELGGCYEIA